MALMKFSGSAMPRPAMSGAVPHDVPILREQTTGVSLAQKRLRITVPCWLMTLAWWNYCTGLPRSLWQPSPARPLARA